MRCGGPRVSGKRVSKLPYGFLADLVVGLHFAFVLFVVFGGLLVLHWPWLAYLHIPAAIWGVLIEFAGWVCPLTPLEQTLRARAGGAGYDTGFIEHYILPVLYPSALTRSVQLLLGCLVLTINLGIYAYLLRRNSSLHTAEDSPDSNPLHPARPGKSH